MNEDPAADPAGQADAAADHAADPAADHQTEALLLEALRAATGRPDMRYAAPPRRLTGGYWAEMFVIRLTGASPELSGDLVARISPVAATASRDAAVQQAVAELGFPTAAVRLSLGPGCAVGRAVTVMDLLPGRPLIGGLEGSPRPSELVMLVRRLPAVVARLAASLHDLDVEPIRAAMAPFGRSDITASLEFGAERAVTLGYSDLARATERLAALTAADRRVVCHGDLHVFNVIFDGDRPQLIDGSPATTSRSRLPHSTSTRRLTGIESSWNWRNGTRPASVRLIIRGARWRPWSPGPSSG